MPMVSRPLHLLENKAKRKDIKVRIYDAEETSVVYGCHEARMEFHISLNIVKSVLDLFFPIMT